MEISGKWKITEAELGGRKLPPEALKNMVLELDETSYQLSEDKVIDSGMLEYFNQEVPAALAITGMYGPNQGKTFQCIYKFDGKDLLMCYNLGGDSRPKSFETKENTLLYLVRYQRI